MEYLILHDTITNDGCESRVDADSKHEVIAHALEKGFHVTEIFEKVTLNYRCDFSVLCDGEVIATKHHVTENDDEECAREEFAMTYDDATFTDWCQNHDPKGEYRALMAIFMKGSPFKDGEPNCDTEAVAAGKVAYEKMEELNTHYSTRLDKVSLTAELSDEEETMLQMMQGD